MHLQKLSIHGIRNIQQADLQLSPGVNMIYGHNGSGKTSVLEAVFLLARGRSFRTRNLKSVITQGEKQCTCFGLAVNGQGTDIPIGVSRDDSGNFVFKVAGEQVASASRLAEVLPLQLINGESFQLLDGAPAVRRGFVDWGVFHVEHNYRALYARFQRCLKHRNSLLRHAKIDRLQLAVWDREFCFLAEQLTEARAHYVNVLMPVVKDVLQEFGVEGDYELRFSPGWDRKSPLEEQLQDGLLRDQKAGFTQAGPHRADLRILAGSQLAAERLSRGQAKVLISALKLAQGIVFKRQTAQECIYLLDDLPAELDSRHRQAICKMLDKMAVQVLVTGVEANDLLPLWLASAAENKHQPAMFHVEHGRITKKSTE